MPVAPPSTSLRLQPAFTVVRPRGRCLFLTSTRAAGSSREDQQQLHCGGPSLTRSELLKASLVGLAGTAAATLTSPARATEAAVATAAAAAPAPTSLASGTLSQVVLRTLSDCQLAVSIYPTFDYNAAGGGGVGSVRQGEDGLLHVAFNPASLSIPAIEYSTTSILGVPIPPPLKIEIVPRRLEGTINPATGEAELEFLANFNFSAAPVYKAESLVVSTTLTSESTKGVLQEGQGQRLGGNGRARLVGVARVPRTNDAFLNNFLMLPTDALAVLSAEIQFS